jgi:hypothetical protein
MTTPKRPYRALRGDFVLEQLDPSSNLWTLVVGGSEEKLRKERASTAVTFGSPPTVPATRSGRAPSGHERRVPLHSGLPRRYCCRRDVR